MNGHESHSDHSSMSEHAGHPPGGTHDKHAGHSVAMFRDRFWISLLLTIPVILYSDMIQMWLGVRLPSFPGSELIPPILGTAIFIYGGAPFLRGAVQEVRDRQPGMMLLIGMAITVAFAASAATTFGWLDLDFWWELASLITIMLLGHWLEMKAIGQARGALTALAELLPDTAERVTDAGIEIVEIGQLSVGDIVLVRPGGRIPADGVIVEGSAEVDESMITGESKPVAKGAGDRVVAGAVATDSAVRVRVEAVGDETALAGIRRLIDQAQQSQSRAQVLADRAAALLFYVAVLAAIITVVGWLDCRPTRPGHRAHGVGPGGGLPPRSGTCHSPGDLDHHRNGRSTRHPGERPPGVGADAPGRCCDLRQDRDPDEGRSPCHWCSGRSTGTRIKSSRWPRRSKPIPSILSRRAIVAAARRPWSSAQGDGFQVDERPRCGSRSRRPNCRRRRPQPPA